MLHVQHLAFVQHAIQVCPLDVYLLQFKVQMVCHCNDGMGGCKLGHRCVCIVIIDASDLAETLGYQSSFVPGNVAHGVLFGLENPLGPYDIRSGWCFLKSPGSCGLQSGQFFMDGFFPQRPIRLSPRFCQRPGFECLCIGGLGEEHVLEAIEVLK